MKDELLKLAERVETYDPTASADNRAAELELHRDVVMATGVGTMNPSFEATFLRSLDAAMTLVPEGWGFSLHSGYGRGKLTTAFALHPTEGLSDARGDAATPALALTAACLRAHASNPEQPHDR